MLKFIHIADVHLGAAPDAQMSWGEKRKQDIRNTFYRLLKQAGQQKIPLVLIAGDLFHGQPLKRELKELNERFADLSQTQIVFIAGNHDYVHPKSYYRGFPWADNVHFLWKNEMQEIYLPQLQTTVYGSSYWHQQESGDVYGNCRPSNRPGYHILLLHGGDAQHRPFSPDKLAKAGFDYIACGHIHRAGHIVENRVVMAGALEPVDQNDLGPHGYWLTELEGKSGRAYFYPIKNCQYVKTEVEVTQEMGMYQIEELVRRRLAEREDYEISHLCLTGYREPDVQIDTERFSEMERIVSIMDHTKPAYDFEKLKRRYSGGLIEKFIRCMEGHPDQELARKALYYGMDAIYMSGDEE